jgi:hypothetical protein
LSAPVREPTTAAGWAYRIAKDFGIGTVFTLVLLYYGGRWIERRDAATDLHRAAAVEQLTKLTASLDRLDRRLKSTTDAITATWPHVRLPPTEEELTP